MEISIDGVVVDGSVGGRVDVVGKRRAGSSQTNGFSLKQSAVYL